MLTQGNGNETGKLTQDIMRRIKAREHNSIMWVGETIPVPSLLLFISSKNQKVKCAFLGVIDKGFLQ